MIYVLSIIYVHFVITLRNSFTDLSLFILLQPLVLFATFRGTSGKDSMLYIVRYQNAPNWELTFLSEPIFATITNLSKLASLGHQGFFAIHAIILCFLFCKVLKHLRSSAFAYTVGPMFLIDGLSNGMRISLAYFLLMYFSSIRATLFGSIISFLSHITISIAVAVMFALNAIKNKKYYIIVFLLISLVLLSIQFDDDIKQFIELNERLNSKFSRYGELVLATRYSGVADLFIIMLLLISEKNLLKGRAGYLVLNLTCAIAVCFILYFLIQQSIAFIRVSKLIIIALCIVKSKIITKLYRNILVFGGLLYSLNYIRQVFSDIGFLPYPGTGFSS